MTQRRLGPGSWWAFDFISSRRVLLVAGVHVSTYLNGWVLLP